jgi:hypothetical protein
MPRATPVVPRMQEMPIARPTRNETAVQLQYTPRLADAPRTNAARAVQRTTPRFQPEGSTVTQKSCSEACWVTASLLRWVPRFSTREDQKETLLFLLAALGFTPTADDLVAPHCSVARNC